MSQHNSGLLLSSKSLNLERAAGLRLTQWVLWSGMPPARRGVRPGAPEKLVLETRPCGVACWHPLFFPALIPLLSLPSDLDMAREPKPSRARLGQKRQHGSSLYQ